MNYSVPRYHHGAPGVIYLNPGTPITPIHQPVFDPTYGQIDEHGRLRNHFYPLQEGPPGHGTILPPRYPVAPPIHGPDTFYQAAGHLGFSPEESHSLVCHRAPPPRVLRAEEEWQIFSSQPWVVSGGIEPMDERGRSILHQWLDRPEPQLYICIVPVEGRLCGAQHNRQDRALAHVRKHLNARPFECSGQCGNPACRDTFGASSYLKAHMHPVLKLCQFCGHEFLRQNVKRHEENCRRRPEFPC